MEKWLPIPGFPCYSVSSAGRVASHLRQISVGKWEVDKSYQRILRPSCHECPGVCLRRDGKTYRRRVANLVLLAFVGECPPGMEVCHNNGDPTNNCLENLRYDSHTNNMRDAARRGAMPSGEAAWNAKFTNAEIVVLRELFSAGCWSLAEFAARLGVHQVTMWGIIRGKTYKGAGGPIIEDFGWFMTEDNVIECRTLRADGWLLSELAAKYGKDEAAISRICRGITWKHAGGPISRARGQPEKAA